MALSAHDVAAVLRDRLPGLGTKKLHKLLYYCQGHHLATFDEPLFEETISAWDMGPVVGTLWKAEKEHVQQPPPAPLTEAELNTVGYVLSRYGALTGHDLEHLTHSEDPWQTADRYRSPGGRVRIENDWIREYFRTSGGPAVGEDEVPPDSPAVEQWLHEVAARPLPPAAPDSIDELRARRGDSA